MTHTPTSDDAHINFMGNISFEVSPLIRLEIMAASAFFGEPQFYLPDHTNGQSAGKRKKGKGKVKASNPATLSPAELRELHAQLNAFDTYDWRSLSPMQKMERAIDEAIAFDPEATLRLAVHLRQQSFVRHTPQIILVRAANHPRLRGTGLVRQYAKTIIGRADELPLQLGYQLTAYPETNPYNQTGKRIPNALTRAWRDALEHFTDYDLAKYREARVYGKRLRDVANLCRPSAAVNASIAPLMESTLKVKGRTWESIVSEQGSSKETWQQAIAKMGHMALLRNLRNLALKSDVDAEMVAQQLLDGVAGGKQLPFRYYSAYTALKGAIPTLLAQLGEQALAEDVQRDTLQQAGQALQTYLAATELALEASVSHLPRLKGRTMALADNSGSAQGATTSEMGTMKVSTIGNLTSILTARMGDEGYVGVFGDGLEIIPVTAKSGVMPSLDRCENLAEAIGQGTENGIWLFWQDALDQEVRWDNVFIFSDMQAGHGQLYGTDEALTVYQKKFGWQGGNYISVPALIAEYRRRVNPKVNVFCVQIAGYEDSLMPENYYRTAILGGWGTGLLQYAALIATLWDAMEVRPALGTGQEP